jgi:hypothetical protein
MNKGLLKQKLIKTGKDLKGRELNTLRMNGTHRAVNDVAIHKSLLNIKSFKECLKAFLEDEELDKKLAKKTITMRFMRILNTLIESDDLSRKVNELLLELEKELSTEQDFNIYIPIKGIELVNNDFSIGKSVRIIKLEKNNTAEKIPGREIDDFYPYSVECNIRIPDFLKAIEIGVETSKIIVHYLRFIDYHIWDEDALGVRLPGYGASLEELRAIAVTTSGEPFSYNWRLKEANTEVLQVDEDFVEEANKLGISKLGEIIDQVILHGELTDIENQILRAILWFGESKVEHDLAARFLKLTLVLECFLNTSKFEPVTATLSDRIAFVLETSLEERIRISEQVRKLYDVRSQIVHTGSSIIETDTLIELEYIVARLIALFLTNSEYSTIKNKVELKNKMEKIKFS